MSNIAKLIYLVLTLAIGYIFIYPSYNDVSALMDQRQQYEDSLEMAANIENRKNELQTKFNNIAPEDRKNIETVLPSSLDFVKLISDIDIVASKYGLEIDQISLKELDSSVGDSMAEAEPAKPYESAIIGFSFESSYSTFNTFMDELESSMRILDIRSLKVSTQKSGIHQYDVEFETYWIKTQ